LKKLHEFSFPGGALVSIAGSAEIGLVISAGYATLFIDNAPQSNDVPVYRVLSPSGLRWRPAAQLTLLP